MSRRTHSGICRFYWVNTNMLRIVIPDSLCSMIQTKAFLQDIFIGIADAFLIQWHGIPTVRRDTDFLILISNGKIAKLHLPKVCSLHKKRAPQDIVQKSIDNHTICCYNNIDFWQDKDGCTDAGRLGSGDLLLVLPTATCIGSSRNT